MAYRGLSPYIPVGLRGVDGRKNPDVIPVGALVRANNIAFNGSIVRGEGGAATLGAAVSGTPICRGLFDWRPSAGTQRLISYWNDGRVLKEVDGDLDSVALVTGLAMNRLGQFIEGGQETLGNNRKLFFCNGVQGVRVLSADGATMTAITSPAADWTGTNQPLNMVAHGGRMWGLLGHRIYSSLAADHEDYVDAATLQFPVYPGTGTELRQGISLNGLMYLFKDQGIFWLDDSDTSTANWALRQKTAALGVASPQAALDIGKDVLFMHTDGQFYLLSAVPELERESGNVLAASLSHALFVDEWIRDNVNLARLDLVTSAWYPQKREAHFSVVSRNSQTPDMRLVWDLSNTDLPRFRYSKRDVPYALGMRKHPVDGYPKPIFGDGSGNVYEMDTATVSKDGAGYEKEFELAPTDFGWFDPRLKDIKKVFDGLTLLFRSLGPQTVSVTPIIDGRDRTAVTFEMQGPGAVLGGATGFTLSTDALGGGFGSFSETRKIYGSGRAIGFRLSNSNAEDFEISGMIPHFRPAASKASGRN